MSWDIKDLDKNKTEQCIKNEHARLDECKRTLDKLLKEYNDLMHHSKKTLYEKGDKIMNLKKSIEDGEEFIRKCNEHLILDFND